MSCQLLRQRLLLSSIVEVVADDVTDADVVAATGSQQNVNVFIVVDTM